MDLSENSVELVPDGATDLSPGGISQGRKPMALSGIYDTQLVMKSATTSLVPEVASRNPDTCQGQDGSNTFPCNADLSEKRDEEPKN